MVDTWDGGIIIKSGNPGFIITFSIVSTIEVVVCVLPVVDTAGRHDDTEHD